METAESLVGRWRTDPREARAELRDWWGGLADAAYSVINGDARPWFRDGFASFARIGRAVVLYADAQTSMDAGPLDEAIAVLTAYTESCISPPGTLVLPGNWRPPSELEGIVERALRVMLRLDAVLTVRIDEAPAPQAPALEVRPLSFLGVSIEVKPRLVSRDGCDVPLDLSRCGVLWPLMLALVEAGESGISREKRDDVLPEQDGAARRSNMKELRAKLAALGLTISPGEPWTLLPAGA